MAQVTLVHLYQAGMFADLDQINAMPGSGSVTSNDRADDSTALRGIKVSAAEAPLKEEVRHKLRHLPPLLFDRCEQVSASACDHPDGTGNLSPCIMQQSAHALLTVCLRQSV